MGFQELFQQRLIMFYFFFTCHVTNTRIRKFDTADFLLYPQGHENSVPSTSLLDAMNYIFLRSTNFQFLLTLKRNSA